MSSRVGRLFAVLLVALLGGALVGVASSTQAAAADSPVERVTYCQQRGGAYALAHATGKMILEGTRPTDGAQHIIPPFDGFDGRNWDAAGQRIFKNGCQIPAVPDQPAAEVNTQPEGEVSCAGNTRRDRTGTTTTEYVWNEDSWAWEPVTGDTVWTNWTSTPLTDSERLEHGCVQLVTPAAPIWTDECGVANNGSWGYADSEAFSYAVTNYSNGKVKIVASPKPGYVFPAGTTVQWQRLQNNSLCVTVPEQPTSLESQCVDHSATPPTVDLPADRDGVSYAFAHDTPNANGFVVTATLTAGYNWGDLSGTGWQSKSDGSVALHHRWAAAPDCNEYVTPVTPESVQPSCVGSDHVAGSINQPAATGQVVYRVKDDGLLYAAIQQEVKGYTFFDLDALPAGWEAYDGKAQYLRYTPTHDETPLCPVDLVEPTVTQPTCDTAGSVALPDDTDTVDYYFHSSGKLVAKARQGFRLADDLPGGWAASSFNRAVFTPTLAEVCPTEQALAGTGNPVRIEFPAFDVFDAECQAGGHMVVVDTDEYSWDVNVQGGTARVGTAADGSRSYGPGTYDVSAVARDGITFEDGSTRYAAGEVMVDGPDPGVCGYSDDDEQTRPTKVLGTSLDGASVPDAADNALTVGGASVLPAGTASGTAPGDSPAAQSPAAQSAAAPDGNPVLEPTPPAGVNPISVPDPGEGVAAPAISVAPLAAGPGGGQSVPAIPTDDQASPQAAPNGAASNKAASNEVVPRLAGSDPAARAHDAVGAPARVAAEAAFVASAGSGVTPYLVLAAGLCLMLMLSLRSRRTQD